MSANEKQVGGSHYKGKAIQPWDYVAANNLGYFEGTAIKYITRWREKGGVPDLQKAIHFLEKLIELESPGIVSGANTGNTPIDPPPNPAHNGASLQWEDVPEKPQTYRSNWK